MGRSGLAQVNMGIHDAGQGQVGQALPLAAEVQAEKKALCRSLRARRWVVHFPSATGCQPHLILEFKYNTFP